MTASFHDRVRAELADIDAQGLREAWAAMQDTHEFFGLTKKFGVERQQSFRLVEGQFAWRAAPQVVARLLDEAAVDGLPIMVFVGSGGCIQIHTGPVRNIQPLDTPRAPKSCSLNGNCPAASSLLRSSPARIIALHCQLSVATVVGYQTLRSSAVSMKVGSQSSVMTGVSMMLPALIFPGKRMAIGTRMPPSRTASTSPWRAAAGAR